MGEVSSSEIRREIAKIDCEAALKQAADRMRFQQEIGLAAIRSIMFVNGGAIIALLTFIGNERAAFDAAELRVALTAFSAGVVASLLSFYSAYLGQEWLGNFNTSVAWNYEQDMKGEPRVHDIEQERTRGWAHMVVASAFMLTGIGTFVYGAFAALDGIL